MADNIPYWQQTPEQQMASLNAGLMPQQGGSLLSGISGISGTGGTGVAGGGTATTPTVPGAGAGTGGLFSQGMSWLGDNSQGLGSLLQGIGALSSIFSTNKQIGLAQDNLNFQKQAYETNLGNQISTYNTNLEDRIRGRYASGDQSETQVQDYLNKNRLSK